MSKTKETTLATLPAITEQYPILALGSERSREIITANLGNEALGVFDLDRIRKEGAAALSWILPSLEGDQEAREFEGIILDWRETRSYWQNAYEGNGGSPPDCSSDDGVRGHGSPGGICAHCPLSKWGSTSRANSKGQACSQKRLLFVLRPGNVLPDVVFLPPTSLIPSRKYFLRLAKAETIFHSVVTRFSLEKVKNYSTVEMSLARRLSPDEAAAMQALVNGLKPKLDRVQGTVEDYEAS